MVTTNDLRRMLEDAWDAAPDGALTLRVQLRSMETAAGQLVAGGSIASISKNSSSQSMALGNSSSIITSKELANAYRILIDLYDGLVAAYGSASLDTADETIYAEMMRRLVPVNNFTKDYAGVFAV